MATINERIKQLIEALDKPKVEIAKSLDVTPAYISKLIKTGMPSDIFITALCREFNVNEHWLRAGEGDMFITLSKEEEIAAFMGDILKDEGDEYKKDLILALANLNDDGWKGLKMLIDNIIKSKQK